MGKGVVKDRAQWRQPEMKEKIDTLARMDPGAPLMVDGGGPVLSPRVAEKRNRTLRQELTEGEERTFPGLVRKAEVMELVDLERFRVFHQRN